VTVSFVSDFRLVDGDFRETVQEGGSNAARIL